MKDKGAEYDALAYGYGEEAFAKLGIPYDDKFFLYRGKGCDACNESGYKGRVGLHELLVATDEIKRLIQDGVMKSIQGLTDYKQIKAVAME